MEIAHSLTANWKAPAHISALTLTYPGELSEIKSLLKLSEEPVWLTQIHTNVCVCVEDETLREADAAVTRSKQHPLVIKTADCLPILLCDTQGTEIAAIHAGWRGLLSGVIESTLRKLHSPPHELIAWTGPAICKHCFEVGPEVPEAFLKTYPYVEAAFCPAPGSYKHFGDLAKIAELILKKHGVRDISHANACTFEEENKFYSYRRGKQTGRMATLIWFNE